MSRILRRPMFRGGRVESRGTGIVSGFAKGGSVNTPKRGLVDGPGGYAGTEVVDIYEQIKQRMPARKPQLSMSDYLQIASAGADILGAPSEGGGIGGALRTAAKPLSQLGQNLAKGFASRGEQDTDLLRSLTAGQIELDSSVAKESATIQKAERVNKIFNRDIDIIDKAITQLDSNIKLSPSAKMTAKQKLLNQRDLIKRIQRESELKILIPGKSEKEQIIDFASSLLKAGSVSDAQEAKEQAAKIIRGNFAQGGVVEEEASIQENVQQTPTGVDETISLQENVEMEDMREPSVDIPYDDFRQRIPATVPDDIVDLIYYNQSAFADFANIETQDDVYSFNNKYDVQLVLPLNTEAK